MLLFPVTFLVVSDIHLGHPRTSTVDIIQHLDQYFDGYKPRSDLDILFLAGDVFERLLELPSDESTESLIWIARLLNYCAKNAIKLRVLEGTPSHDWKQSVHFLTLANLIQPPPDVKYVSTLSIEQIPEYGLSILYVPDEWSPSTEMTYAQVQSLLASQGLAQVDIAIMHGSFGYQLPAAAIHAPRHSEVHYLALVKYYILIGHIHTFSVYERIIAQGSFDRLAHGEEEAKGGVQCTIEPSGNSAFFFIENKHACLYKTLQIRQPTLEGAIAFIEKRTALFPKGSHVRLKANKGHPLFIAFEQVRSRFIDLHLTKLTNDEKDMVQFKFNLIDTIEADYVPITITRENIADVVFTSLLAKQPLTERELALASQQLNEVAA